MLNRSIDHGLEAGNLTVHRGGADIFQAGNLAGNGAVFLTKIDGAGERSEGLKEGAGVVRGVREGGAAGGQWVPSDEFITSTDNASIPQQFQDEEGSKNFGTVTFENDPWMGRWMIDGTQLAW